MASVPTKDQVERDARSTVEALLRDYDAFFFDCDGTLYHAGTLLPEVAEAVAKLRALGKATFFVTNTSSRSREQLQAKLAHMGVPCEVEECVPSGVFSAAYIQQVHPDAKRLYIVGGQGLLDEFRRLGFECSGGPEEDHAQFRDTELGAMALRIQAERYDGVVVGWDTALNYYKIVQASLVFQLHPGCFFYATNDDPADRVGAFLLPGNGCLLPTLEAACEACAPERKRKAAPFGVKAVSLGKPNPDYARFIARWSGLDLTRSVMVGDRLDTDVDMGIRAGMGSCFVLTGVDGLDQILDKGIQPTHILPQVGCLAAAQDCGGAEAESDAA